MPRWTRCPFFQCLCLPTGDNCHCRWPYPYSWWQWFAFKPVSFVDIHAAIKHFSSQACGENRVLQSVVANALPVIGDRLLEFSNASFARVIFPTSRKRAKLLALKKATVPFGPSDFRPIALLCFLSKVLVDLAHNQIVGFLEEDSLLYSLHTGFRKFKMVKFLLLLDCSKAFDTIPKLLVKLRRMGLSRGALL